MHQTKILNSSFHQQLRSKKVQELAIKMHVEVISPELFPCAILLKLIFIVSVTKGVEDLDFFIGDEAFDASGYAVKVRSFIVTQF